RGAVDQAKAAHVHPSSEASPGERKRRLCSWELRCSEMVRATKATLRSGKGDGKIFFPGIRDPRFPRCSARRQDLALPRLPRREQALLVRGQTSGCPTRAGLEIVRLLGPAGVGVCGTRWVGPGLGLLLLRHHG